jgi:energy-coupling factor transporter ATP-binding protein EcfA2
MSPSEVSAVRSSDSFRAYSSAVETLLISMPAISSALDGASALDDLPGWRSMRMRYQAFCDQGGQPVQVAMLFGPSGAGKSTLFRQLTGIEVPAGGEIRPMTFGCAVAAPTSLASVERLGKLFPSYQLVPLSSSDQLGRKDQPADLLYFAASDQVPAGVASAGVSPSGGEPPKNEASSHNLPLVLVDVPDFTTFCTENWVKAERMLERAEIVIFVVFDESYSDNRVIENLALACRKASFLAYLFTKTTRDAAEKKWHHLLSVVKESQSASQFSATRFDGRTVLEFLADAPVYHSPRSETPQLTHIAPVLPSAPAFHSLLVGQDAERIILNGLLESTSHAIRSCQEMLAQGKRLADELVMRLDSVHRQVLQTATAIAQGEFPMLRLLSIAVEEAQGVEHGWLRAAKAPLRWLARSASSVYATANSVIQSFRQAPLRDKSVRPLADLEREAIQLQSEELATTWRLAFPLEATTEGMLSATRCAAARTALLACPVPEPTTHWENVIREAVRNWCKQHRAKAIALSACGDMFAVAAGGIVVLDLVHTGGLGLGSASVLAGAPAAAAAAAKLIERLNLRGVAERALAEWQLQRQGELARHLQVHFADPLFQPWIERSAALNAKQIAACQSACQSIERLFPVK